MTSAAENLLETINLTKGIPVNFIYLRRETGYDSTKLRQTLDELIKIKKIKQSVTDHGTVYKVI